MDYCLSCFGKSKFKDGERAPLLPKHTLHHQSRDLSQSYSASPTVVDAEHPVVDKIVDVLAALNAGKLPTQDQISNFLQVLLKSELLKDVQDKGKVVPGYGPLSKEGRKVLADVRVLVQAALQFGMEKNADNKLQELYFQIAQIDSFPVEVNVDKPTAYKAGQTALDKTKEVASELVQESPSKDEVAVDAQTFIHALRTLVESSMSSSIFRLILVDLVSIAREQFADTAADVEHAAHEVEQTASELERKARARPDNDIIVARDAGPAAECRPELDVSAVGSVSVDDVKKKGQQVVDKIKISGESAKREWEGVGEDVRGKAKQRTLERMQQLMARIQKDPSSRSALRAILILIRKYAERVSSASEVVSLTIETTVAQTQVILNEEANADSPQENRKRPFIDVTADALLGDFKTVLERFGQGHSLDGVLMALSRVVRDLEDVPLILEEEVNEKIEEKLSESTPNLKTESEPCRTLPSPTPTPPAPQLSKSQKKKLKKKQRALEKARESASPTTPTSAQPEAVSSSESQSESQASVKASSQLDSEAVAEPSSTASTGNPFRVYFLRVGEYLDKSLDPEWAMSSDGMKMLEALFDDGVELTHVVSGSVAEVGKEISEGSSSEQSTPIGGETKILTDRRKELENEMRRRFKTDFIALMNELEAFIAAMENDKTTMALIRAFDTLGTDLTMLIQQEAEKKIGAASSWTNWLGWAIPRTLSMIPNSALPIPSLEVKTGKMEAALRPLFVRGVGRTSNLATSLVPDEVVLKEWTEMRIDMADHEPDGPLHDSVQSPGVRTTSRVRMHMDGIRARVEGMGYYFKYKGGLVGYEDEGVLSVDVGMEGVHEGLEMDVEVEVENGQTQSRQEEAVSPKVPVPDIIVEDADTGLASESGVDGEEDAEVMRVDTIGDAVQESALADPLFRVVDVLVAMHGLHFKIDQSKHWIINKLLVQPLAGPVVGRLVKKALEEKIGTFLESLAQGLGEILRDAKRRGDERRARAAERTVEEQIGRIGQGEGARPTGAEVEAEMVLVKEEEGLAHVLGDWWSALLHTGPSVLGRKATEVVGGEGEAVQTRTSLQATARGVIYTSTSTSSTSSSRRTPSRSSSTTGPVQEQPQETAEMVYHPETKSFEHVDMSQIRGVHALEQTEDAAQEEEVVVAVGGAQLFPGKAGAPAELGVLEGIKDYVRDVADEAGMEVREGVGMIERAEERWDERMRVETSATRQGSPGLKVPGAWESDAFDW